jgi:hypothetical protein
MKCTQVLVLLALVGAVAAEANGERLPPYHPTESTAAADYQQ